MTPQTPEEPKTDAPLPAGENNLPKGAVFTEVPGHHEQHTANDQPVPVKPETDHKDQPKPEIAPAPQSSISQPKAKTINHPRIAIPLVVATVVFLVLIFLACMAYKSSK